MKASERNKIVASYKLHDTEDISTMTLLQMVADDCRCSISDVLDALTEQRRVESEGTE